MSREAVIVDSVRTALAKAHRGSFNQTRPDDQLAHCLSQLYVRNKNVDKAEVGDVIAGCGIPEGAQGMNVARIATIATLWRILGSIITLDTVEALKNFPFRILFLCIFLPPVLYILTLNGLERYLGQREAEKVQELMIQDQQALNEGRHTIKEEINRNIGRHLREGFGHKIGIKTGILVKTRDDRILYPSQTKLDTTSPFQGEGGFAETGLDSLRYTEVASENYRILTEGLVLDVSLQIGQNTWLSNSLLIVYIFLSLVVLQAFVRRGVRRTEKEEGEQKRLVQGLSEQLNRAEMKLQEVESAPPRPSAAR